MPPVLQDYHNYSKFLPTFFKAYSSVCGEVFWKHEIRDIIYEKEVPDYAVAAVRVWTREPETMYVCFMNSSGFRIDQNNPIEITNCVDMWLVDVRSRKEEFDAFMQGVAINYSPLSVTDLDRLARPQ
jgi:hypothetical protein